MSITANTGKTATYATQQAFASQQEITQITPLLRLSNLYNQVQHILPRTKVVILSAAHLNRKFLKYQNRIE